MNRIFWLLVLAAATALSAGYSHAGEFTLLAGVAKVGHADDGTYWNQDKEHTINLTTAPVGLRYDTRTSEGGYGIGVQGLYFGMTNIPGLASTKDWQEPGGYNPSLGHCNGPCAPLATWRMQSETSTLTLFMDKHFDNWSVGAGLNVYEIKTSGYVQFADNSMYRYKPARYMDFGGALEAGYRHGKVSVRFQFMPMEGRGAVPSVSVGNTYALLLGYTL